MAGRLLPFPASQVKDGLSQITSPSRLSLQSSNGHRWDSIISETVVGSLPREREGRDAVENAPTIMNASFFDREAVPHVSAQAPLHARKDTTDTLVEKAYERLEHPEKLDSDLESGGKSRAKVGKEIELMDQTNLLPPKQLIIVFIGLSIAMFVGLLDQTIVSTALPQIAANFNSAQSATWVATAYVVTSTVFQPMYSRLSDIFGRRGVLCFTLALFGVGSIAAAVSRTITELIVFRAFTGIGGGGIVTLVQVIVSDIVSLRERGKYQGILGGMTALANGAGPLIGGAVTTHASWRWCFWIDAILAGIGLVAVIILLPSKPVHGQIIEKLKQIDYAGIVVITISTVAILVPLSWGGTSFPWDSAAVIAPLLIGCALVGVFIIIEWKFALLPTVPLRLFRNRTVLGVYITTFFSGAVYFSNLFFLPDFFQIVKNQSPIRSGISLLPLVVSQTVVGYISGLVTTSTGEYKIIICVGFALWTIGSGLLSTLSPSLLESNIIGYFIISGVGAGQVFQTTLVAAQAAVDRKDMAVVTGVRNFMRLLGAAISLAVCQAILNNTAQNRLVQAGLSSNIIKAIMADPTSIAHLGLDNATQAIARGVFSTGVRNIFYFNTPCTALAFFASLFFIQRHSLNRGDEAEQKAKAKEWIENHGKATDDKHEIGSPTP